MRLLVTAAVCAVDLGRGMTIAISAACLTLGLLTPIFAEDTPPKFHHAEVLSEFNRLVDAGDLDKAENLARDAFLQSSSNPQAVLMVRQIFLMRKLQELNQNSAANEKEVVQYSKDGSGTGVRNNSKVESIETAANIKSAPKNAGVRFTESELSVHSQTGRANSIQESKELREELQSRVFAVADLTVPVAPVVIGSETLLAEKDTRTIEEKVQPQFDRLIDLITHTIEPESWTDQGGHGTIAAYKPALGLVIRQTPSVQAQVEGLLSNLRKDRDVQVQLEVQHITVSRELLGQACREILKANAPGYSTEKLQPVADLVSARVPPSTGPGQIEVDGQTCTSCEVGRSILKSVNLSENAFDCCKILSSKSGIRVQLNVVPALTMLARGFISPACFPTVALAPPGNHLEPVVSIPALRMTATQRQELISKVKSSADASTTNLGRLSLFNGQSSVISAQGKILKLCAVVGADRSRLRLSGSVGDAPTTNNREAEFENESKPSHHFILRDGEAVLIPSEGEGEAGQSKNLTVFMVTAEVISKSSMVTFDLPFGQKPGEVGFDLGPASVISAFAAESGTEEPLLGGTIIEGSVAFGSADETEPVEWITIPSVSNKKTSQFEGIEIKR